MAKKKSAKKRKNIAPVKKSSPKKAVRAKKQKKPVKSPKKVVSKNKNKIVTSSKKDAKKKEIPSSGKNKVSKKRSSRGSSRYRTIQKILSDYTKEHGIKLGKGFNKAVAELYRRTQGQPLKFVEQNIDILYSDYLAQPTVVQKFPNDFPFYQFMDTMAMPIFDRVQVGVTFQDSNESINYEGLAYDVQSWYSSNLHPYLRQNYNESPVAFFQIVDTDNKTYVQYQVVVTGVASMESEVKLPPEKEKKQETPVTKKEEKVTKNAEVDLEIEKQKTIDKEIKLQEQRQKVIEKEIELVKEKQKANIEKINQIKELKALGFSNDEIKGMLS